MRRPPLLLLLAVTIPPGLLLQAGLVVLARALYQTAIVCGRIGGLP